MKHPLVARRTLAAAAVAAVLVAAAAVLVGRDDKSRIDALQPAGPGPLDDMTFVGMLGPDGGVKDVRDIFVFRDGTFVSLECRQRCDYPARPYTTAATDAGWAFESTTRCPYKNAMIKWRGTVSHGKIKGVATWTMKRWYWTITRDFAFAADLDTDPDLSDFDS